MDSISITTHLRCVGMINRDWVRLISSLVIMTQVDWFGKQNECFSKVVFYVESFFVEQSLVSSEIKRLVFHMLSVSGWQPHVATGRFGAREFIAPRCNLTGNSASEMHLARTSPVSVAIWWLLLRSSRLQLWPELLFKLPKKTAV